MAHIEPRPVGMRLHVRKKKKKKERLAHSAEASSGFRGHFRGFKNVRRDLRPGHSSNLQPTKAVQAS